MNEVVIRLLGREYILACEAGAESVVQQLATKVEEALAPLSTHHAQAGHAHLLAMGLLMLQDQLDEQSAAPAAPLPASDALEAPETASTDHAFLVQTIHQMAQKIEDLAQEIGHLSGA